MSTAIPKTSGLVTIRYVVASVLNRMQDYSFKQYKRLVQIAIEGFTEDLAMYHVSAGAEVVYLHMSTAKTVSLPSDFVNYIRIGYPSEGKLKIITRNDSILLPRVWDDGDGSAIGNFYGAAIGTGNLSDVVFFSDHWRNGQFVGGLFGVPGGFDDCSFRIDTENRQIVFSGSTPRSEIVMEYISSGLKSDGSSLIPREVVQALRNYILWQKDINDPRVAMNLKEMAKREYDESIAALRDFQLSFTASEYLQMSYSSYRQSPKR
jgi:hypothetical protein